MHTEINPIPADPMVMPEVVSLREREDLGQIPNEIEASWRRSLFSGLRPEVLHVPYDGDVETESQLDRMAGPVLDQLAEELNGTGMIIVLATADGRVVERWVPDRSLHDRLDAVSLAPGYRYSEDAVGTSGIGMAIEHRRPAFVRGPEHFAEALTDITCSAAPIVDPRTQRVIGIVSLASHAAAGSPLMLPMATRAAREIEHRVLEEARTSEHALFDHYLRTANRTNRPVVSLNAGTMIANEAASRLLQPSDQAVLRELASQALAAKRLETPAVTLASGALISAHCEPVYDGGELIGITVRLSSPSEKPARPSRGSHSPELPGLVGESELWRTVTMRAGQAARSAGVVQIVGEPGAGKLAVAKALLESVGATPVHVHDAADASNDPAQWLAEFDRLVGDGATRVVLRHAHLLDDMLSHQIGRRLDAIAIHGPARVVITGDGVDGSDIPEWALRFSVAYTITVPSLRRRREDIPVLFSALASALCEGVRPAPELAPGTLRALLAYSWPGNTRQLSAVVRHAVLSATGPTLRLADLPGWLHGKHPRRSLSTREQLEFDAIVEALQATEGNRVHAANRLGMARSTLYRKLAAYGIDPDEFKTVMAPAAESAADRATDERQYEVA